MVDDMTHACSLEKSSFSLNLVREAATDALRRVLGSLNLGDIELFVEPRLLSLFHHAISLSGEDLTVLRVREIHSLASPSAPPMPTSTVVYIVRPQTTHVQLVAQHLLQQLRGASSSSSVVLHTDVLSRAGVGNQVAVHPFQLGFIPTDNDMLTLAHDTLLRDCYIQNNKTTLTELGHALHVLQQTTGDIPTVHYKGELAKAVWKSLSEFNAASPPPSSRPKKLRIDHMIILDRKLDYIAPLSTPLTHEALLAELLGLQNGTVTVDATANAGTVAPTSITISDKEGVVWSLNGDDRIFQDIRNKHIQAIGPYLHSTSAVFAEERKHMELLLHAESTTVKQLDELGTTLNQHMDKAAVLSQHIALAELVQTTTKSKSFKSQWQLEKSILERQPHLGDIEALVWQHAPVYTVLRLLCLHSLANQGLPKPAYMHLKTQCIHLYGFEYLHVFENLEAMGVLATPATSRPGGANASAPSNPLVAWNLTGHFDCDPCNPDDPSYVAGGYCPLTVKLVQAALSPEGWTPLAAQLNMLPGPSAVLAAAAKPKKTKKVLVVIVGGISPIEITALRFVGQKLKMSFLIASDTVASGKAFLGQAMEPIANGLMEG